MGIAELANLNEDDLDYKLQIPGEKSADAISRTLQKLGTANAEAFTWS